MNININSGYINEMNVIEQSAKTLLRKQKKVDSWFLSRYAMNIYRGCMHNCVYCDGRSEKYNVEGPFGEDVIVKTNAVELLRRELDPKRKRKPMKPAYVLLGGGVGDSYQPVEKKYQLSRKILQLLLEQPFPVSILTKSTLVERDIDLIKAIQQKNGALVNFSFSSVDDAISSDFEPRVPSPAERLKTIIRLKKEGVPCGMFLMPVIPFLTDSPEKITESVKRAADIGIDYIIFGGMTLKEGRQNDHFMAHLNRCYPQLAAEYKKVYLYNKWGNASSEYYAKISETFINAAGAHGIPVRIPIDFFKGTLDENDMVVVILEHMDYVLKMRGEKSPYGYAAYSVSQLKEPLTTIKNNLQKLKGVGPVTARIIKEVLEKRDCLYYRKLMKL